MPGDENGSDEELYPPLATTAPHLTNLMTTNDCVTGVIRDQVNVQNLPSVETCSGGVMLASCTINLGCGMRLRAPEGEFSVSDTGV